MSTANVNDGVVPVMVHFTRSRSANGVVTLRTSRFVAVFAGKVSTMFQFVPSRVSSMVRTRFGVPPDTAVTSSCTRRVDAGPYPGRIPESPVVERAADATTRSVEPVHWTSVRAMTGTLLGLGLDGRHPSGHA